MWSKPLLPDRSSATSCSSSVSPFCPRRRQIQGTIFQPRWGAHFRHLAFAGRDWISYPDAFSPRCSLKSPAGWSPLAEQKLSLGIAVVLFLTYFCVLGFSLRTHKYFFQCAEEAVGESGGQWSRGQGASNPSHLHRCGRPALGVSGRHDRKRPALRRRDGRSLSV